MARCAQLLTHGPRPFCATRRCSKAQYFGEPQLYWDPLPRELYFDPNILDALRVMQREYAMHSAEYASTFSTGYAPLRIALDKWWRDLRSVTPGLEAYRPYNASDEEYDRLLWLDDREVKSSVGVNPDLTVGMIVDHVLGTSDTPEPPLEVRSKFVGFALEYGIDPLIQLSTFGASLDPDHLVGPEGSRRYPLALMEAYIDRFAGDGVSIEDYYENYVDDVAVPAVNYSQFRLHAATGLHETGDNVEFELASNGDLFAIIKSGTGSHMTEVHVLSAASNYREFALHAATALHETGNTFDFVLKKNRDLVAVSKSGTGTGSTELHVLSAASNYGEFVLQTGTAFHETDDNYEFFMNSDDDLVGVLRTGASGRTEVHILSAASDYQHFTLHAASALEPAGPNFAFALAPNGDLFAIKKSSTGTRSTEVHVLSARHDYEAFKLHTGSALGETGANFDFAVAENRDLVAIAKSSTGSGMTEVHTLHR